MNVTKYYNLLARYWQQLDMLERLDLKDPAEAIMYRDMVDKKRTFKFLYGLRKELDETRGRIMSMRPIPKVRAAFAEIKREESRRRVMNGEDIIITTNKETNLESSALVTAHGIPELWGKHSKEKQQTMV